jgi:hypothetical protein
MSIYYIHLIHLGAVTLIVAGLQDGDCATSLDLVSKNIDFLNFCGQLGLASRESSTCLSTHYERFREADLAGDGDTLPREHFAHEQPSDYLFIAITDSSKLHGTSYKLFERFCNPYANDSAETKQHKHDASSKSLQTYTLESHQTPPDCQACIPPGDEDARMTITSRISNLED